MALDEEAADSVVGELGDGLGMGAREAAAAILTIAGEHMVGAIREITINQGIDPREVLIVAGGGAAGLNIAAIAQALDARNVLIPSAAGALSAFGGQHSDVVFESGVSVFTDSGAFDFSQVGEAFAEIGRSLDEFADSLSAGIQDARRERFVEARYAHQVWTLELPLRNGGIRTGEDVDHLVDDFHRLHERMFAVREPGQRVELLHCRGRVVAAPLKPGLAPRLTDGALGGPAATREAYFPDAGQVEVPVYEGASLPPGTSLSGPLLITEPITTVVVPPGVTLEVTRLGNYLLEVA
jgi:N-methylhydantoinase A